MEDPFLKLGRPISPPPDRDPFLALGRPVDEPAFDDSASWQPPEEAYQPAPVEQFGPPAPVGRPNVEQFGPPDLPQYQPTESLQVRDPRSLGEIVGFDPAKSRQVEVDSATQIYNAALEDFDTGRGREYNAATRTYSGIPPKYTALYEKAINEANDRKRVRDLTFKTEDTELEANRQVARQMGPFLTQLAATGERLPTGLASIPLRAAGMGAGVDELARRSAMSSQVANEIGGVGNVLGKGVGTAAEAFLNRGPGKYGAEIVGGAASGLTALNDALSRGVDSPTAAANAVVSGLIEGGIAAKFKQLGFGGLESVVGDGIEKGVARFLAETGAELTEENLTTITQGLASRLVEDVAGRNDLGGLRSQSDFARAIEDTTLQTLAAMGAAKTARTVGDPQGFKDAVQRAPREILDFLAGKESLSRSDAQKLGLERTSAEERAQLKAAVDARIAELDQIQPELKEADPSQRQGQQYAEPLPEVPRGEGMSEDAFAREIQQSDSTARRYIPTQQGDDFGLDTVNMPGTPDANFDDPVSSGFIARKRQPNRDQRRADLLASIDTEGRGDAMTDPAEPRIGVQGIIPEADLQEIEAKARSRDLATEAYEKFKASQKPGETQTGELPLDKATERFDKMVASVMGQAEMNRAQVARQFGISREDAKEVLYEAAIRKEMRKGASRNAAIRRVRNASDPEALPREEAVLELAQSAENERQRKLAEQQYRLDQAKPPREVPTPLTKEEALAEFVAKNERGGIDRRKPSNEIDQALAELDNEQDQGYEPDQREISVDMNKKYGALLDDFESEQLDRIEKRRAGDKKQVIVNPHPVTGLIEGKWANQRLAEMSVQRALAQNKPVTYVEGDFHNLGGLNAKFGQTGADRHLKNVTTLFKRFLPENSDVALVHKGGDEYGFHFIGMTADEVRAALDKSKPFIEAYSKKHDLGMVPHTKEGKSGGVGVNYSVVQFDPKKHKADVYTDTQGKPLRLNQAGALIYEADRALEAEKKKHGKVKGQAARTDGGRGEGQRVSQPSVGEAPVSRPAGRQGSVDKVPDAQGKQPSGSGEAVSDEASQKRRAALEKRLPGSKITPTKKGYKIDIRGKELTVEYGVPKASRAQAERELGRKLSDLEWSKVQDKARGQFQSKQGTAGKVVLREDHGDKTADHEVFHVKKQFLTEKEWKALKKQYGKGAGDKQAEEYIAQAREKWDGSIKGEGDKVFAAMDQESFFDRIGEKPPEPPKTEKASGEPEGRPELANPGKTPEARKVVDVVDEGRKQALQPGVRPQAVERKKAEASYKADPEAAKKKILSMDRESMSEQDVHLARIVVNDLTEKALKSGSETDMAEAVDAIVKYRTGGTETARALAARYDYSEKPAERMKRAVREALLTPPKEYASKIANSTGEAKKAAQRAWAKRVGEIKNALNLQGIDLDNIEGMNQQQASTALNAISAENAGYWDAAFEYWRNAILSAPMTHAVNVTGNTLHTAWNFTAERMVESAINAFRKTGSSGATFGEFKHLYKGLLPGISQGFKNAVMAFKTEQPIFQANDAKTDSSGVAISGLKGKIIRAPQRALLFADEFAKTLIAQMEAGAQAYRIAKKEGLDGVALEKRISELHTDTNSEAWQAAIDKAIQLTFQESSKASQIAIKARNLEIGDTGIKPLQYIVPFITTPLNILKIGIMKSPLGSLSLGKKIVDNYREGKPLLDGATDKAAQQLIAAAAMWALVSAIKDSDDEWITGTNETAYDPSKPGKSQFTRSARPPQSVRIGDKWYSYARIEPFATSLSGMVDFAKGGTGAGAKSILGQLEEKTFLKGLADLINVIQQPDSDSARRWATNFATSWVPNIVRNPARGMRDSVDERSAWGKGELYRNMAVKRLAQGTELPFTPDDMPRYNVWGEELKKSAGDSPNLDVIARMISPVQALKENKFVGARVIMNWNEQNEDKQVWPLAPPKNYKVGKETKYMTEKQYDSYVRETGQELAKRVARAAANWNVEKPTEQNIKWIQEQTENIRSGWRKRNLH